MLKRIFKYIMYFAFVCIFHLSYTQTSYVSAGNGNWDIPTNWTPNGVPNVNGTFPYDKVTINHDLFKNASLTVLSSSSITVNSTGKLSINGGGNLTTGNWGTPSVQVNTGGIINVTNNFNIIGAETVTINGTVNATNFTTSGSTGGALTIGGNLNLSGNFTHNVARTLTLNNGNITTGGSFTIGSSGATLNTTGATIKVGTNLLVDGSAKFNHASDTLLVGGNFTNSGSVGVNFYGWVDIAGTAINSGSSNMTFNGPTTLGNLTGSGATNIIVNSELLIEGNINLSGSADIKGGGGGTGIIGWNGTFTTDNSGSGMSCDNGTEYDGNTSTATPPPPFNPLDLGTCNAGTFVFLPVTYGYFRAEYIGNAIELSWSTVTEENNDYFTVMRSTDGINFKPIGYVQGAGNSNELITYSFVDDNISANASGYYYQLVQTDYDRTSTVSEIVYVTIDNNNESLAWVKNPATNNEIIVTLNTSIDAEIDFALVNSIGVNMNFGEIETIGDRKYILRFNEKLSSGLYILTLSADDAHEYFRVIVE